MSYELYYLKKSFFFNFTCHLNRYFPDNQTRDRQPTIPDEFFSWICWVCKFAWRHRRWPIGKQSWIRSDICLRIRSCLTPSFPWCLVPAISASSLDAFRIYIACSDILFPVDSLENKKINSSPFLYRSEFTTW